MASPDTPPVPLLQPGDHFCGVYRSDHDHRRVAIEVIRNAVARDDRILYLVDAHTAAELKRVLSAASIDVEHLLARGQLVIMTAKEAYFRDGEFDPEKMLRLLATESERAKSDGFAALAVTGEMTWALAGEPGSERLIEYEAKLNTFFPGSDCYAVCQYDRRKFDADLLLDILHNHPKVLLGTAGLDNSRMYYVPPEGYLGRHRQEAMLDCYLGNLADHPLPNG